MEQEVPNVVFIGKYLEPLSTPGQIILQPVNARRVQIEYRVPGEARVRQIGVHCLSGADQFPVRLQKYDTVKNFVAREKLGNPYRYIVLDESVSRVDMVSLKVKNPDARIVILRTGADEKRSQEKRAILEKVQSEKLRASDIVRKGGGAEQSGNPVFQARVMLRNMQLEQVRHLLVEYDMTTEEMGFIRTFLQIMIRNDQKKAELQQMLPDLESLSELYRLGGLIASGDREGFDQEISSGVGKLVYKSILNLISLKRKGAQKKLEEILYWEWEYRLRKNVPTGT